MSDTCSLFPPFGDSWPSCLLPSHGFGHVQMHMSQKSLDCVKLPSWPSMTFRLNLHLFHGKPPRPSNMLKPLVFSLFIPLNIRFVGEEHVFLSFSLCLRQSSRFLLLNQHRTKRLNLSQPRTQKGDSAKGLGLWGPHTASCWSDLRFSVRLHIRITRIANGDAGA